MDTQPSILPGIFLEVQCAFKILMIPKSCNSYYISHFAAFFIVVGAKKSIAESCITFVITEVGERPAGEVYATSSVRPTPALLWLSGLYFIYIFSSGGGEGPLVRTSLPRWAVAYASVQSYASI